MGGASGAGQQQCISRQGRCHLTGSREQEEEEEGRRCHGLPLLTGVDASARWCCPMHIRCLLKCQTEKEGRKKKVDDDVWVPLS